MREETKQRICSIFMAVCAAVAMVRGGYVQEHTPLPWLVAGAVLVLWEKREGKIDLWAEIAAVFFAICSVLAKLGNLERVVNEGNTPFMIGIVGECLLSFVGWYALFAPLVSLLLRWGERQTRLRTKRSLKWFYLQICMGVAFLCWLPYFLTYYPGIMSSDSIVQLGQALGDGYSNHHPWVHTLLIQFLYQIGYGLFGTPNAGVALFTIVSMLFLAFAFSCVWLTLYRSGVGKIGLSAVFVFYVLLPINAIYAVTMWKDIFFAVFILLFSLVLWVMDTRKEETFDWKLLIVYGGLSLCVCLFRSNGLFAYAVVLPFLVFCHRKNRKGILLVTAVVLLVTVVYKGPLLNHFQVRKPDMIESLSIPAQQIAGTITYGGDLSQEERNHLSKIVDVSRIPETYRSYISDPIKDLVREHGEQEYLKDHGLDYLKTWATIGIKNPFLYVKTWCDQTKGYWYHSFVYPIYTTGIVENGMQVFTEPKLPQGFAEGVDGLVYFFFAKIYQNFWSLGASTWLAILCFLQLLRRKKGFLICLPAFGVLLSLLVATPISAEFRYAYPVFLVLPLLLFTDMW